MSSVPRAVCRAPAKCEHLAKARQHSPRLRGLHRLEPAVECVVNCLSPRETRVQHYSSKAALPRVLLQQLFQSP